jgi:hypothetical protein
MSSSARLLDPPAAEPRASQPSSQPSSQPAPVLDGTVPAAGTHGASHNT